MAPSLHYVKDVGALLMCASSHNNRQWKIDTGIDLWIKIEQVKHICAFNVKSCVLMLAFN